MCYPTGYENMGIAEGCICVMEGWRGGGDSLALPWELGNTSYPHSGLRLTALFILNPSSPHKLPHSVFSSGLPSPVIAPVFDI